MAKYDDFGRPIYETAEEYNRAKKAENNSHTYSSPDGDTYTHNTIQEPHQKQKTATERHAIRTGSKKAKTLIVGLIAFAVAINVVIVFTMFNMVGGFAGSSYEDHVDSWISFEEDEGNEEYLGDDTTPLPEGFETFTYKGQNIMLPTTFEELSNLRFVIDVEYGEYDLMPSGYEELLDLKDEDGNIFAIISVDNYTEDEIPLGKCEVDYFSIQNPAVYDDAVDVPDFVFGDGLTFESSYEELEAYFGIPYYHYEDHSEEGYYYDSYEWQFYGEYEGHFVTITFWNGEISDVSIQKSVEEEIY